MMDELGNQLEQFWNGVLSRDPVRIRIACTDLTPRELQDLRAHLEEMVHGEGWHPEQRESARQALAALAGIPGQEQPPA